MTDRMDTADHTGTDALDDAFERSPDERTVADGAGESRMSDVSHTPPEGEGTNGVWARGADADADAATVRESTDE